MKVGLSIRDVLAEVDFELAQGVVARQDLRRAIREIRRLHERNRQAVFGASATGSETATPDLREALRRQFQVDDMILAVLGEAVSAAEEARERSRRLAEFVRESLAEVVIEDEAEADSVTPVGAVAPAPGRDGAPRRVTSAGGAGRFAEADRGLVDPLYGIEDEEPEAEQDVEWAMRPERLIVSMDSRDARIPLVSSVFGRLRNALHSRVLIYIGSLGEKQIEVNRVLGDHLLRAVAGLRRQHSAIESLRLRVTRLERRATATRARPDGDGGGGDSVGGKQA